MVEIRNPAKPTLSLFKIGGKVIDKPEALKSFLEGFQAVAGPKILVHGGGVIADVFATKLEIPTQMHEGRRITSREMRDLVTMVYGGGINKTLVAELQNLGCDAIGLTGADAGIIRSQKRPKVGSIDYGYVGDIKEVNHHRLKTFLDMGLTPVLAPLTLGEEILNTNADSIAGEVASAMSQDFHVRMYYGFEAKGVLLDVKDPESLIQTMTRRDYEDLLKKSVFTEGMLPKLSSCFAAIRDGVSEIILSDAANGLKAAKGEAFVGTRLREA